LILEGQGVQNTNKQCIWKRTDMHIKLTT